MKNIIFKYLLQYNLAWRLCDLLVSCEITIMMYANSYQHDSAKVGRNVPTT